MSVIIDAKLIEMEYHRLGYKLGWRFLMCSQRAIKTSPVAVITLNPSGGTFHEPAWSNEDGNAYVTECWRGHPPGEAPLQRQMRALFREIGLMPEEILTGVFVPFRSPRWDVLPKPREALAVGHRLWASVLANSPARRLFAIGRKVEDALVQLTHAKLVRSVPAAWGAIELRKHSYADDRLIIGLPHLSMYQLFSRDLSAEAVRKIMENK